MSANVTGNPYMTTFTTVVIVSAHGDTRDPLIKVNVFDYLHKFLRDFEISLTPEGNLWHEIEKHVNFRQWDKLIVNINGEKIECDILQTGEKWMQVILNIYDPKKEMSFKLLLRDEEENIFNKKIEVRVIGHTSGKTVKNFRIGLEDSQNIFDQIKKHVRKNYWKSFRLIGPSGTNLMFRENEEEYIKELIFKSYKQNEPLYILLHMNVDDLPSTEQDEAAAPDGIQEQVYSPQDYPSMVGMNVSTYPQAKNASSHSLLPEQLRLASGLCIPAPAPWR